MNDICRKIDKDNESDLDRKSRELEEKKQIISLRRDSYIKEREKFGFPPKYPLLAKLEDFGITCSPLTASPTNELEKAQSIDKRKPQNMSPEEISAFREGSYMAPSETLNKSLPMNERFVGDQVMRGKFVANLGNKTSQPRPLLRNSVFPQLDVLNTKFLDEDAKKALNHLFTTSYQAAYGNYSACGKNAYRRLYPIKSLETVADPVKRLMNGDSYYPATESWIPELFEPTEYDRKQARYPHINEKRPYEFCSYNLRINQIPGYSGSFGTNEKRVDSDNPYCEYKPLNLVRQNIPQKYVFDLNFNMPGYTGYQKKEIRSQESTSSISVS
ncbi:unnamed protein product [Schistosoma turkestanicum]|nr:unnamed protein product [Schistosoma turkestanicum]